MKLLNKICDPTCKDGALGCLGWLSVQPWFLLRSLSQAQGWSVMSNCAWSLESLKILIPSLPQSLLPSAYVCSFSKKQNKITKCEKKTRQQLWFLDFGVGNGARDKEWVESPLLFLVSPLSCFCILSIACIFFFFFFFLHNRTNVRHTSLSESLRGAISVFL